MKGTFRNDGGPGNGSATFNVYEDGSNRFLGSCTAKIERAEAGGTSEAGCPVTTGDLATWYRNYMAAHRDATSLPLHMQVTVN